MLGSAEADLRLGRWQDVLSDVICDACIFDAPHSTSANNDITRADGYDAAGLAPDYEALSPADIREVCESWSPRTRGWMVSLTDWALVDTWRTELARIGRYAFPPVPCVIKGMSFRAQHDGPSSWTLYAVVARPRTAEFANWGIPDGAYVGTCGGNGRRGGTERSGGRGKWPWLMGALVRDYSRKGDLVCDPFAGWGSTLRAAEVWGRRAVGAEVDEDAYREAKRRLAGPLQTDMFAAGGAQ